MRIVLLKACGDAQDTLGISAAEGHDLCDRRHGVGKRAGLVKDDGVGFCDSFKVLAALDGDVVSAAFTHSREHRKRHG